MAYDRDLKPAQLDLRFKQWICKGITSYCLISTNTNLESLQHLTDTHNLGKQDFGRYLQLRRHFDEETKMSLINGFIYAYKSNSHKIFQEPFDNSDSPKIRSCVKNNGLKNVLKKWFNGLKKKV